MSTESGFRASVLRAFKRRGVAAVAVEAGMGGVEVGTPDVAWARGWIELKVLPRWPRAGRGVRLEHFTREQLNWALRWVGGTGVYHMLVRVPGGRVWAFDARGATGVFTGKWEQGWWQQMAVTDGTVEEVVAWLTTTGE